MYQTPAPTPSRPTKRLPRRRRRRRSDGSRLTVTFELVLAALLLLAVAAAIVVGGGSGWPIEVFVLVAGSVVAFARGWPISGHAALATGAAYLILETVFGRLGGDNLAANLLLTAGVLGAVLAAGFARRVARPERSTAVSPLDEHWTVDPWADEAPGRPRLRAGTLEYEVERARRAERPLSVLAIRPDDLEELSAAAADSFRHLLEMIDHAIEATVRAVDIVSRSGQARFEVILPETGPEAARTVAERIRLRIDSTRPELTPGQLVGVSVSIGVASYPGDGVDDVELSAAAERALVRAAELGGNRTLLYSLPPGAPRGWAIVSAGPGPAQVLGAAPQQVPRLRRYDGDRGGGDLDADQV
jgi:diguanylate cyclase (GGDEF)-like protein